MLKFKAYKCCLPRLISYSSSSFSCHCYCYCFRLSVCCYCLYIYFSLIVRFRDAAIAFCRYTHLIFHSANAKSEYSLFKFLLISSKFSSYFVFFLLFLILQFIWMLILYFELVHMADICNWCRVSSFIHFCLFVYFLL